MAEQEKAGGGKRVSIIKIYVKDFSFESPLSPGVFQAKDWQPSTNLNLRSAHTQLDENMHEIVLTITVEAEDVVSGIAEKEVRRDAADWQVDQIGLMTEGRHTLEFRARDVAGNETGARQTSARLDLRPPTGAISLKDGAEMIMPGDHVDMDVELITPIAIEVGQRFAIREGGRTVGAGVVSKIIE